MMRTNSLLSPLVADLRVPDSGWASRSLGVSIRRSVLLAVAAWHLVMVAATLLSLGASASASALVAAYMAVAAYVLGALDGARPRSVWFVPAIMALLGAAGYLASGEIGSVLVFAACWQINFASCAAGLLVFSRWIVPAVFTWTAGISACLLLWLPEWGWHLPTTILVTQIAIVIALRLCLPLLLSLAERADAEEAKAERAHDRAEVARRVSAQVAEEARVLHDTAINTLGAIANGGAGVTDIRQVRGECARNVAVLETLRGDQVGMPGTYESFRGVLEYPGIPIRRHGIDDAAVERLVRSVPDAVAVGMVRASREAVLNANKHSHASHIDVTFADVGGALQVEISDDGVGFDGDSSSGSGVTNSIFGRSRDAGFDASLVSSPGGGTTVTLTAVPHGVGAPAVAGPEHEAVDDIVAGLHRRAGLLWGGGVSAISVLLTVAGGTNHYYALYPMVVIMGLCCVAFYVLRHRTLAWWGVLGLTASTIAVFFFSAAATAFGTDGAVHWQALAATGPFILLLSSRPSRRTLVVAGCVWGACVTGAAVLVWPESSAGAAICLIAGGVGGAFAIVWARFMRSVAVLGVETARAQRRALQAGRAADADQAAQETYRRWVDAGLDSAAGLLRSIADGARDPREAATRDACGLEESYLRQLILVSPELVHLGHAIMPTLRYAREQGLSLGLRLGGQDVADESSARSIAATVSKELEASGPGALLTVSVFPVRDGLQLTVISTAGGGSDEVADAGGASHAAHSDGGTRIEQFVFPASVDPQIDHRTGASLTGEGRTR